MDKVVRRYPSDLTDGQWQKIKSLLPKRKKRGRKPLDRRTVIDAILYVNGSEVGRETMNGKLFEFRSATVRQIGRVGDGTISRHWDGLIDDLRIYNRPLTPQEITDLAQ